MNISKYPNSGLFSAAKQPKINPKSPDFNGKLEIDFDVLQDLITEAKGRNDGFVTLNFGGWVKQGQYGEFYSLKVSTFKPQAKPQYQQRPAAPAQKPTYDDSDVPF